MQQRFRGSISRARRALICAGTTVALAATMTVAAAFTSPAAQAATPSYKVAVVGDSWISGEGLENYLSGTDTATNQCHRSTRGWTQQVIMPGHSLTIGRLVNDGSATMSLAFTACSGATIPNVLSTSKFGENPQLGRIPTDETHVFLSIGGNDLHFKERVEHCANPIVNCLEEVGYLSNMLTEIDSLKPQLTTVLTKIRERASSARIILTGYARLFSPYYMCLGAINSSEAAMFGTAAERLDQVQAQAAEDARRAGVDVSYVSLLSRFDGRGDCSLDRWINPLVIGAPAAMHPNLKGHTEIADLVRGPIAVATKAGAMKKAGVSMGLATSNVYCGLRDGGCGQRYEKVTLFWSPATGAHYSSGQILGKYGTLGYENGAIGYPTNDRSCGLADSGCVQSFQNGRIYSSASAGANWVHGTILTSYLALGAQTHLLAYPTSDEFVLGSGRKQNFQGGAMYWSSATGAHFLRGQILDKYVALGQQNHVLGFPTKDRSCGLVDDGCYAVFSGGRIYSYTGGAFYTRGQIMDRWLALGAQNSTLGYPDSDRVCNSTTDDCHQSFQDGALYSSTLYGAKWVHGLILNHYLVERADAGWLGSPTTDEKAWCGMRASFFEHGKITWQSGVGTKASSSTSTTCPSTPV